MVGYSSGQWAAGAAVAAVVLTMVGMIWGFARHWLDRRAARERQARLVDIEIRPPAMFYMSGMAETAVIGGGSLAITNNSDAPITEVTAHLVNGSDVVNLERFDHVRVGASVSVSLPQGDGVPRVEWSDADGRRWRRDRIGEAFDLQRI